MITNLIALLRQANLLSLAHEQNVVNHIEASGASVPEALIQLGIIESTSLANHLSQQLRILLEWSIKKERKTRRSGS